MKVIKSTLVLSDKLNKKLKKLAKKTRVSKDFYIRSIIINHFREVKNREGEKV